MLNCPSCGAQVPVRGPSLPYGTCPYCQTLILREGLRVEDIGKVAVLPYDVSPIQLGTMLVADGRGMTVVGRVRWAWSGGSWNEWLAIAETGAQFWLAEAAGMFMLTAEWPQLLDQPKVRDFARGEVIAPGDVVEVEGRKLFAIDIKQVECLGSEGDLPIPTAIGTRMTSVDFRSASGEVLSLQRDERGTTAWFGDSWDLLSLKPGNLRELEGWTMPGDLR
ncbi:MAG: DUF4178 domain-containing protein [Novosphingobium sp.]